MTQQTAKKTYSSENDLTPELRIKRELEAHENGLRVEGEKLRQRFRHVFECPNTIWGNAVIAETLQARVPGADVLEIGCSNGNFAERHIRLKPHWLVGIDMYPQMIEAARQRVPEAEFRVMDAHSLDFPDQSFDVVVGSSILHHLEYERAIMEIVRVLRPGGVAIFDEPLRDNPGGKIYRALTPKARTKEELPLSKKQILWADRQFGSATHRFSGLVSTALGLLTSFTGMSANAWPLRMADTIDQAISKTPLRFWMRRGALVWQKSA